MAGGNLPFGFAPSGSLTSYTPTLRERATDWMRKTLFSDDRAGQGRAEKVMDVVSMTPFGFGLDVYDAGREAGMGNYGTAGLMLGMAGMPGPGPKKGIRAYQGSPHNFAAERLVRFPEGRTEYIVGQPDVLPDVPQGAEVVQDFPLGRMRMDKIGTGEGAQAYGHGLYFAENEGVAKGYRDALSRPLNTGDLGRDLANYAVTQKRGSVDDAIAYLNREMANYDNRPAGWPSPEYKKQYEDALGILTSGNWKPAGRMYEVNIAADPNTFLDWDKPLSEQGVDRFSGLPDFARPLDVMEAENVTGQRLHQRLSNKLGEDGASTALRKAGIPGIKYLDAGSRNNDGWKILSPSETVSGKYVVSQFGGNNAAKFDTKEAAEAFLAQKQAELSRNYVVFDDRLIEIVRKYGIAGASAMLGYNLLDGMDPAQAEELKRIEGNQ